MTVVERLAPVERSKGVASVSVPRIETLPTGTDNSCATIWQRIVRAPCPTSVVPAINITLPSASKRTKATETGIASESETPTATPAPLFRCGLARVHFNDCAAAFRSLA